MNAAAHRIGFPMNRLLTAFALVASVLLAGVAFADGRPQFIVPDPVPLVAVTASGPVSFRVEIADDAGERELGLMFREDLPEYYGMLFVFDKTAQVGFWMKDTPIALDLVFCDQRGVVTAVRRGEPESVAIIAPDVATRFVLELEAGTAQQTGIRPGVRLFHPVIASIAGQG